MTEKEFQAQIIELAGMCGWWVYHTHDSRRSQPGWPDLVLLRGPESWFVELKTDTGRLSRDQELVLRKLREAGHQVAVWRPADWDAIKDVLRRKL